MAKMLNETIGTVEFDGLIVSNVPVAKVATVTLAKGAGVIARGTLITGTAGGELAPASAALSANNAVYVLADDTDVSGGAATATAYRSGHFARNKVGTGAYNLTAADAEVLRKSGILLSDAIEA